LNNQLFSKFNSDFAEREILKIISLERRNRDSNPRDNNQFKYKVERNRQIIAAGYISILGAFLQIENGFIRHSGVTF
jgi:hypothetical protein